MQSITTKKCVGCDEPFTVTEEGSSDTSLCPSCSGIIGQEVENIIKQGESTMIFPAEGEENEEGEEKDPLALDPEDETVTSPDPEDEEEEEDDEYTGVNDEEEEDDFDDDDEEDDVEDE